MDALALADAWVQVESAVAAHARFPPGGIPASVWPEVARGDVGRLKAAEGAVGVGVLPHRREAVWLAITDDHPVDQVKGLSLVPLRGTWAAEKLLYQRLDLPWPVQDRHWVLETINNHALFRIADAWERIWTLAPDSLAGARSRTSAEEFDEAAPVVTNEGSWILLALTPGSTLAVYTARVNLGGALPEGAAEAYAASTLRAYYASVERNAASMSHRYSTGCTPQPDPSGAPIPCFTQ